MAELIREYAELLEDASSGSYEVRAYGEPRADGSWEGWIAFQPLAHANYRRTERETTQPSRRALEYWAAGLEPVYFEGAFARAHVVE
jgi:hypothetical protein